VGYEVPGPRGFKIAMGIALLGEIRKGEDA